MNEERQFTQEEALKNANQLKGLVHDDIANYVAGVLVENAKGKFVASPLGRNHKEQFYPKLVIPYLFKDMVKKLYSYAPAYIEPKNKKDAANLIKMADPASKYYDKVIQTWRDVEIDYFMAINDVIFKELLKDFATFIAVFTVYHKRSTQLAKQDPRLAQWFADIYEGFDPNTKWFSLVMEDLLTLAAGMSREAKVPVSLLEWKKLFYNTLKEETKVFKQFIADSEKK